MSFQTRSLFNKRNYNLFVNRRAVASAVLDTGPVLLSSTIHINAVNQYAYSTDALNYVGTNDGSGSFQGVAVGTDLTRVLFFDPIFGLIYTLDGINFLGGIVSTMTTPKKAKVNGSTWICLNTGAPAQIYRSVDSGMNWSARANPNPGQSYTDLSYNGGVWYAVGFTGATPFVIKSVDDGLTWTSVASNMKAVGGLQGPLALTTYNGRIYAAGNPASGPPTFGIASSADGASWATEFAVAASSFLAIAASASCVIATKLDPNFVYRYNGVTWSAIAVPAPSAGSTGFQCVTYRKSTFIAGNNAGDVYTSIDDGLTWVKHNNLASVGDAWESVA